MAAPQSKKKKFLSLEQKAKIIAAAAAEWQKEGGCIAEGYDISPRSLSTILKSFASILNALASGTSAQQKKTTQPAHVELDKAVKRGLKRYRSVVA